MAGRPGPAAARVHLRARGARGYHTRRGVEKAFGRAAFTDQAAKIVKMFEEGVRYRSSRRSTRKRFLPQGKPTTRIPRPGGALSRLQRLEGHHPWLPRPASACPVRVLAADPEAAPERAFELFMAKHGHLGR